MSSKNKILSFLLKKELFVFAFIIWSTFVFSQATNTNCANAKPFCTGQTMNFPAVTGNTPAQPGPNYGCLGSQPRPSWFFMQINTKSQPECLNN